MTASNVICLALSFSKTYRRTIKIKGRKNSSTLQQEPGGLYYQNAVHVTVLIYHDISYVQQMENVGGITP